MMVDERAVRRFRRLLEEIRDGSSDKEELIMSLENLLWGDEGGAIPSELRATLADLLVDLDGYEPDAKLRREDSGYFGEERLRAVVSSFLEYLDRCGYGGDAGDQEVGEFRNEEVLWSLRLEASRSDSRILECLGELTDGARFRPRDLVHDPAAQRVSMVLFREATGGGEGWKARGRREPGGAVSRKVSMVFRAVSSCEATLRSADPTEWLTALGGVEIASEGAYLRSSEEAQRRPVYEVRVRYRQLEVEIVEVGAVRDR